MITYRPDTTHTVSILPTRSTHCYTYLLRVPIAPIWGPTQKLSRRLLIAGVQASPASASKACTPFAPDRRRRMHPHKHLRIKSTEYGNAATLKIFILIILIKPFPLVTLLRKRRQQFRLSCCCCRTFSCSISKRCFFWY